MFCCFTFFSFSSRFGSSLLLVLPPPLLALVLVLLSVSLRRRLLLLVCCPGHSIPGPLHPRTLQSACVASPDVPVRGSGCTPGRTSPGVRALLLSASDARIWGVFLPFSLRRLGRSSPWPQVPPRTILSWGFCRAPIRAGCSNPGLLLVVFSPLSRTLQSVAPGLPPDDPVWGLVPCFIPPRLLQSGASFNRILSAPMILAAVFSQNSKSCIFRRAISSVHSSTVVFVFSQIFNKIMLSLELETQINCRQLPRTRVSDSVASDAPVRGTWFTPGRSSPGAWAVLHSAPDAPIRGVFLPYYLRCLGRSSPWHQVQPRTILSGGLCRAPLRPGCSNPGRLFAVFSPLPRTLRSVAPGSPPDDPVRGLVPCFIPPRLQQSGASFCRIPSVASDAPVDGTWFTSGGSSPGASAVLHSALDAPIRGVFLPYSLRCLGCSSPWHRVLPRTIQSGGLGRAPLCPGCSIPGRLFAVFSPLPRTLQSVAPVHPRTIQSKGLGRAPLRPGCSNPGRHVSYSLCCLWLTNPTARAEASWLCALWGRPMGAQGGAPLAWVWGVRGRALTYPQPLVLSGVRPGPTSRWPWVRCAGVGARLSLAPCPVPRFVVCCARFPGSPHPVAVVAWNLSLCRGLGRRCASLACLVAPRWCAPLRPVRSLSVLRSAFPSPWCLPPPRGLSPPALLGGCAGHVEAGREPGSLCLPLAPAKERALGALRVVPVRGPAMGLSLAGPSGFGLELSALRWFGVC